MSFIKRVIVLFYVILLMFISAEMLLLSLQLINFTDVARGLSILYFDNTLRLIVAAIALFLVMVNYLFYQIFTVNVHRDKIIAFDNPNGRVSVSLLAMEELVKRMLARNHEIRESKINIKASRKGLNVGIRLNLTSEVSIPNLTSKIQSAVLKKVQDLIGLDESVNVTIYVSKLLPDRTKEVPSEILEEKVKEDSQPSVPFHGYRG